MLSACVNAQANCSNFGAISAVFGMPHCVCGAERKENLLDF